MSSRGLFDTRYKPLSARAFLHSYIRDKLLSVSPNEHIEVELRLGRFTAKPDIDPLAIELSNQNPLILQSSFSNDMPYLKSITRGFSSHQFSFDPNISSTKFFMLERLCSAYLSPTLNGNPSTAQQLNTSTAQQLNTSTAQPQITLDILIKGSSSNRVTWDLRTNQLFENSKRGKENIDILHQGEVYRLSTARETTQALNASALESMLSSGSLDRVRLKTRRLYRLEFSEIALTKVATCRNGRIKSDLLALLRGTSSLPFASRLSELKELLSGQQVEDTHEAEIELADVGFLTMKANENLWEFTLFMDRFFRYAEVMIKVDDAVLGEKEGERAERVGLPKLRPVVGTHLQHVAKELEKIK